MPDSTTTQSPGSSRAWTVAFIVGILLMLGMCGTLAVDGTPTNGKTSSWCEQHRKDTYRGAIDNDKVQRYIDECR